MDWRRREFLVGTAAGVASGLVSSAWGAGAAPSEVINVGVIGVGGRGRHLIKSLSQISGARVVTLCDASDGNLGRAGELFDRPVATETDYRRVLDRADIDAVVIATPDHWHVPMTIAACEAGKDVYCEKPLTHSVEEGAAVVEAERRTGRRVQVGTQHRSMPHLIEARQLVRDGVLGEVYKASMAWNRFDDRWLDPVAGIDPSSVRWKDFLGSAPAQEFDPYRFVHWRWFWDFGGGVLTDLMVHWLDTVHWMLDVDPPTQAQSLGDNFRTAGLWQTPDTVQTMLRFGQTKLQAHFEGGFVNNYRGSMLALQGDKATLYMDRGRYELTPQPGSGVEPRKLVLGERPPGADWYPKNEGSLPHLRNWVECIRSGAATNCPASEGVRSAIGAHLANEAVRSGEIAVRKA